MTNTMKKDTSFQKFLLTQKATALEAWRQATQMVEAAEADFDEVLAKQAKAMARVWCRALWDLLELEASASFSFGCPGTAWLGGDCLL